MLQVIGTFIRASLFTMSMSILTLPFPTSHDVVTTIYLVFGQQEWFVGFIIIMMVLF
jgi:hypothetical protein